MLYREIITVCSQVYTKQQNVELLSVKPMVYIVTTGLYDTLYLYCSVISKLSRCIPFDGIHLLNFTTLSVSNQSFCVSCIRCRIK
jgi:hypothetical protein